MQDLDGYVNAVHPLAFAAKANALNTPNYYQAMNQPDAPLFVNAMEEEMAAMEALEAWEIIDQANVPYMTEGNHKARLCVRGDQQVEGIDYFETYAPVVSWSTVRTVDYTNAFVQAELPEGEEVYMSLPRGWEQPGK
eukprot:7656632-Ditylum_brightwellii.AAC.1